MKHQRALKTDESQRTALARYRTGSFNPKANSFFSSRASYLVQPMTYKLVPYSHPFTEPPCRANHRANALNRHPHTQSTIIQRTMSAEMDDPLDRTTLATISLLESRLLRIEHLLYGTTASPFSSQSQHETAVEKMDALERRFTRMTSQIRVYAELLKICQCSFLAAYFLTYPRSYLTQAHRL